MFEWATKYHESGRKDILQTGYQEQSETHWAPYEITRASKTMLCASLMRQRERPVASMVAAETLAWVGGKSSDSPRGR